MLEFGARLLTRHVLTEAFVAVCAERNGGRVLTLDRRHFDVLSRELGLTVLP